MKTTTIALVCAFASFSWPLEPGAASDWPQWRGPDGTGYVKASHPPIQWSETTNIRWKMAIPGQGFSSPIIVGDRIYLTTSIKTDRVSEMPPPDDTKRGDKSSQRRLVDTPTNVHQFIVLALDRNEGTILWQTMVREGVPAEGVHPTSSFASASIVTDGDRLFAFFGSHGLFALDLEGNVQWEKDLGVMVTRHSWGEGATPALHGDRLIVPWDHEGQSFVVALDVNSGSELWRTLRDEETTWATPIVTDVGGKSQAIMSGNELCMGYDLATGQEVWRCAGLTSIATPTPIAAHGLVYLTSGSKGSAMLAIKLDAARGDISNTEAIAWTHDRSTPYVPSPMLAGRNLYFLGSNSGKLSCFDAIAGTAHYQAQRLGAVRNVYASIVGGGGYLFVCGQEGNIAVIKEGPEFELVGINTLDEGINATPAIVDDALYIRTESHLYCVQGK